MKHLSISYVAIMLAMVGGGCGGSHTDPLLPLLTPGSSSSSGIDAAEGASLDGSPRFVSIQRSHSDRIELAWEEVPAKEFRVLRKAANEANYTPIATTKGPSYTDTSAENDRSYEYAVETIVSSGSAIPISASQIGAKVWSDGCAVKMDGDNWDSRIARLPFGFSGTPGPIAFLGTYLAVGTPSGVVLLNRDYYVVASWSGINARSLVADSARNVIYALANKQILRLKTDCETEVLATLPADASPRDAAIDSKGNIYVSEYDTATDSDRIFRFDPTGCLLNTWNLPQVEQRPEAIYVPFDGALLIADARDFNLKQYTIQGDQLVQTAIKPITSGLRILDVTMSGGQILVALQNTEGMKTVTSLQRFHSGMNGGSVVMTLFNRPQDTRLTLEPGTGAVFATDVRAVHRCNAPLFLGCDTRAPGSLPRRMVRDESGNFYILHGAPFNYVARHNSNGAFVKRYDLPEFSSSGLVINDMAIQDKTLYISGGYNEPLGVRKHVMVSIPTALAGHSVDPLNLTNWIGFGSPLAVVSGKVFSATVQQEQTYLNYISLTGGNSGNYASNSIQGEMWQANGLRQGVNGQLYYLFEDLDFNRHLISFDTGNGQWGNERTISSAQAPITISTDNFGRLFSIEGHSTKGYGLSLRNATFDVTNQNPLPKSVVPQTLWLSCAKPENCKAYLTTSVSIHRFDAP